MTRPRGPAARAARALALTLLVCAAGCGQKGPLLLPGAPAAGEAADDEDERAPADDERQDDE